MEINYLRIVEINDLPNEVLVVIFRRVDLLERLKLRSVCLRWKRIIEDLKIEDISIVDSWFNIREKWLIVGLESINYQNLIYYCNPSLHRRLASLFGVTRPEELPGSLGLVSKHPMFSRMKSMFISLNSINDFCFQRYINPHFPNLEELSCFGLNLTREARLSLSNLKVLSLHAIKFRFVAPIRLEVPKMYKFLTSLSIGSFEFVHPTSVTHLCSLDDHESIVRLFNLEYLSCYRLLNERVTLSKLKKLKELHLFHGQKDAKKRFAAINQARKLLGRYELQMFVNSLDYQTYLNSPTLLTKYLIQNYVLGKMVPSPVLSSNSNIYYDDFLDEFEGLTQVPSDFKLIFSNIRMIAASKRTRKNVGLFFDLLSHCSNIHHLDLESAFDGLGDEQASYDSLPFRCKYVRDLWIDWSDDRRIPIDPNFILNFVYLQKLEINQSLRPEFVQFLFEKLKYFRELNLRRRKKLITIAKNQNYFAQQYLLRINQEKPVTFFGLGRLLASYRTIVEEMVLNENYSRQ